VDLRESPDDRALRDEVRTFLQDSLSGDFAAVRGRGGPGDQHALFDERLAWERHLAAHGWTCVGWPKEHGGRGLSLRQQVIYYEEYARAEGPGRVGLVGEGLAGPTIIAFGDEQQQERFLPPIVAGTELWCQGYSEPNAGSDLANVQTRAELDGSQETGAWVITGQKVWTSLAHWADWCFVLARTSPLRPGEPRHRGLSYLLVPMHQDNIEIRPIDQLTGDSEFNELFFDGARTAASHVVGEVGDGWRVAMGTLAFERGASTLGQQLNFRNELDSAAQAARRTGRIDDPVFRQRLAGAHIRLEIMRLNALRMLAGDGSGKAAAPGPAALTHKLYWASLHRDLGELAMDALGPDATLCRTDDDSAPCEGARQPAYDPSPLQRLFLFSRADTIYGGSNEIQRNIIGERGLGLPKEPR
jgi:alkylation response protein AidB-like acyl-CoA dehydrogenase